MINQRKSKQIIINEIMDQIIHGSDDTTSDINYNRAIRGIINKYQFMLDSTTLTITPAELAEIKKIYHGYKMDENIKKEISYFAINISEKVDDTLYRKCAKLNTIEVIKLFSLIQVI